MLPTTVSTRRVAAVYLRSVWSTRGLLALCITAFVLGVTVLSHTGTSGRFAIVPSDSPIRTAWTGEQEHTLARPVDGDTDIPSIFNSTTTIVDETVETQSSQSVDGHGVDVGQNKATLRSPHIITTTVANEAPKLKTPTTVSIHLVIVLFTPIPNDTTTNNKLKPRQLEHITVLQRNLNHSLINRVYIMTGNGPDTEEYLHGQDLPNRHKISVVESKQWYTMRGVFQFISDNLVGKDTMYANGDMYLGNGFENVNATELRENKIFYALSRRGKQEEACKMEDYCGGDFQYLGSHDVFLFHLKEPIPEVALQKLDFKVPSSGSENVLIAVFAKMLHYCSLNPCKTLETYHLHCSGIRPGKRERVNTDKEFNGRSYFTSSLSCRFEGNNLLARLKVTLKRVFHFIFK